METTVASPAPASAPKSRPAPSAAAPAVAESPPARPRPLGRILLGVVGVGVLAWIVHFAIHAYHYEETDNAYITGHLHQISAQIDAPVAAVLAENNQEVKAGDVLVRLDPLQFEIGVKKAEAALAQARAQQAEAAAAASQAEAQVTEMRAHEVQAEAQRTQTTAQLELTRLTLSRNEQLFAHGGAVTQADVDTARSAYDAMKAEQDAGQASLDAAKAATGSAGAALTSARAKVEAAAAAVAVADAALRDAQREAQYANITAPAPGRVGNRMVEVGNRVLAGQILFALAEPEMWVVANFKETQLAHMQAGQDVELTVDALPGQKLHGKIASLAPATGSQFALLPPDNATGNFNKVVQRVPVKILLDEPSRAQLRSRQRLGLSVIVEVKVR